MSATLAGAFAIGVPLAAGLLLLGWRFLSSAWRDQPHEKRWGAADWIEIAFSTGWRAPVGGLIMLQGVLLLIVLVWASVIELS